MENSAPRKMILLDPDLDSDPSPRDLTAKNDAVRNPQLIPSPRTLIRFLNFAQSAVRLRGEVTVLLTTDAAIRKLNRQFRGKNKATDVLSFPAESIGPMKIAGDLAISVDTAGRQSAAQGHSLAAEIKILILHGLLHLAGYDHEIDDGKMARRERLMRAKLKLPQGLIERTDKNNESIARSAVASRREAGKLAPDEVRRGTRRTQSGESHPTLSESRGGDGIPSTKSARSVRP